MTERETEASLADLLSEVLQTFREEIHVALPGVVKSYNAATQTADIQPQIKRALRKRDGSIVTEDLPILPSVPVGALRAGGFFFHMPVTTGDHVLVIFCERDINEWRRLGSNVDPADLRTHSLSGAVAIPMLEDARAPISGLGGTGIEFGHASNVITVTSAQMQVGGNTDAAALASKVDALAAAFNAHTHATAPTGPISTPTGTYVGGASGSTKLKVGG